jgi:mannosyltransferase OCH1-like enzyme
MNVPAVTNSGQLIVGSMPIGNYDDITIRMVNAMRDCDIVFSDNLPTPIEELLKIYNLEKDSKAKSDIARLLILYFNGGIFIDPYSVWVNDKNLNDLITKAYRQENNFFVAKEPNQNWIGNGVMGSIKNHPALNFLLEKLEIIADGYQEIREKTPSYVVTGPVFVNRAVMDNYPITIFSDVFFYYPPKSWNGNNNCMNNERLLEQIPKTAYIVSYNYTRYNPK